LIWSDAFGRQRRASPGAGAPAIQTPICVNGNFTFSTPQALTHAPIPAVSPQMGVIAGDTNGDSSVDSTDVSQTKSQSGNSAAGCGSGFREDINLDGFVDGTDVSFVKSKSGGHLP
jgi:hypothetical protein